MKNLIYKELRLSINPLFYLITLLASLILIPNWVYFIAISYLLYIALPNIFTTNKAQNDIAFSVLLPVRKRDVVGARVLSIAGLEVLQMAVAGLFCWLNHILYHNENFLLNPNAAYIGFGFMMFGVFNLVFFPMFYKTAFKVGIPAIIAVVAATLFATGVELVCLFIPWAKQAFDAPNPATLIWKIGALIAGMVVFVLLTFAAYRASAKRFERINL